MVYPKSILTSCVLLFSFLALGLPSGKSETSCGTVGNTTCSKVTNMFQSLWNKSLEVTFNRYKLKLISVTKCHPNKKMDSSNPVNVVYKIRRENRDTTLLDVELRISERIGPLIFSCRGYTINQNSMRDLIYKIDKVPCSHTMISQFVMILQIKMDHCIAEPGVHKLNNINLDNLAGAISAAIVSPGIYAYELEIYHSKGVLACDTFNSQVTERRKSKP